MHQHIPEVKHACNNGTEYDESHDLEPRGPIIRLPQHDTNADQEKRSTDIIKVRYQFNHERFGLTGIQHISRTSLAVLPLSSSGTPTIPST